MASALDRQRLWAVSALAETGKIQAALKSEPRPQRELEGRARRRIGETYEPVRRRALMYSKAERVSKIRAVQLAGEVHGARSRLRDVAMEEALAAGQYGRNRITGQLQRLTPKARGEAYTKMGPLERTRIAAAVESGVDNALRDAERRLYRALTLPPGPDREREIRRSLDVAANLYGRELANGARSMMEGEAAESAARRYGLRKMWEDSDDNKVRTTHRDLDGVALTAGKRFANGLLYPREGGAKLSEVMGCRCRIRMVR